MGKLYGTAVLRAFALVSALLPMLAAGAHNGPRFMENRGQWPDRVGHHLRAANADVFFERDRIVFNFIDPELLGHSHHDHDGHGHHHERVDGPEAHAYHVIFEGAASNAAIEGRQPYSDVTNYFRGNDPSQWASGVRAFEELHYHGIYPGIDLHYYGHEGTLKYDVIVAAGAAPSAIAMRYEGVDGIFLKDGQLHVRNTFNEVVEMRPVAYQTIDGKRTGIRCEFSLTDGTVGFIFPEGYDETEELIIDPVLIFSSYSGSFSDNFGFTATYDDDGALYGGGITFGNGYPVVTGSYSTGFVGQADMAISKFAADGSVLLYSCIIGGTWADAPHSMVVNSNGELVILGSTSSANYPVTAGAFDASFNGGPALNYSNFYGLNYANGADIVLTILSADGSSLVGSTFFGGSGTDGINQNGTLAYNYGDHFRGEVIVDGNNRIYINSSTQSGNIPVTPGAYDQTLSGTQDAVIARFSPDVSALEWCTYLGGNSADAGYSLKQHSSGDLFVVGGTLGQGFPTTAGALNTTYQGGMSDGYIARLTNDGSTLSHSTYIGTSSYDQTYFVEVDDDDDVYVYGQTLGAYPVTAGVYSNNNGRQFIQKVNADLGTSLVSTVFGSGGSLVNISPTAFLVDICGRIYISGWGGGTNGSNFSGNPVGNTNGMPVTPGAFQTSTDGSDFYFMVLEADAASLLYATFFGAMGLNEHVDGGTSRFNSAGVIHQAVCAGCGGSSAFPTTPGVVSNTNNASNCNLGVIKLDMEITGVSVDITAGDNSQGCAPLQVQFNSQLANAADIFWDFGDGNTSTQPNPQHTFTQPGTYVIALVGMDTVSCTGGMYADTAYATVIVNDIADPADAGADQVVCDGASVQIGTEALPGYTYSWSPAVGLSDPNTAQPIAGPTGPQTYTLTVTDANGCQDQDQVQVGLFDVQVSGDTLVCADAGTVQLSASAAANWTWTPANLLNDPNAQNPTATVTETTVFTLEADNGQGCTVTRQVTVQVAPLPVADAGADETLCQGGNVTLNGSGGQQYSWSPATFLNDPNAQNPISTPQNDITYTLTVTDANGCTATADVSVQVNTLPDVDADPDLETCPGEIVQLQASGALTYVWSPATGLDDPQSANPQATVQTATTYTVIGTDANGCENTAQVTIDIFDVNITGQSGVCPGSTVQLGVDGGVQWAWTPANLLNDANAQNPTATVNSPTVFTVEVSNGLCTIVRQVSVDVFAPAVADAGADQTACSGDAVNLSGSGGVIYQWSPATFLNDPFIANPVSTPQQDITYTLTVTDQNGCTATDAISVTVAQLPTVVAAPDVEVCEGDVVQLQAGGALTYLWSPATGLDDPQSVSPQATASETVTYTVTGTDANGCVNTAAVTIDVFDVQVSGDTDVCPGSTVQLGVDGGIQWSWAPATVLNDAEIQNPIATLNTPTVFTVGVSNGVCYVVKEIAVNVFPPPVADAGPDLVACDGAPVILSGSGGLVYQWSPGTYLDDPTAQNPVSTPEADITYTLDIVDGNGCTASDDVSVAVLPSPTATVGPDVEICAGQSTELSAEGGEQYSWTPLIAIDNPNSASPTVNPVQPTVYVVTVTDVNGCTDTDSVMVSIFTVMAFATPDGTVCLGDSTLLTASNGVAFSWSPPVGLSDAEAQSTYATPLQNEVYTVTVTSQTGCEETAEVAVEVVENPVAAFSADFVATCEGVRGRFTNLSEDADRFRWDFSIPPDSLSTTDAQLYFPNGLGPVVTLWAVTEGSGCSDSITVDYSGQFFTNDTVEVFWPNVITPNNDGMNDCFRPGFIGEFSNCYELTVYNRWGALLFESVGTGNCWDGRTKAGTVVPEGTYYYIARVLEKENAGWVQVIRD